MTTTKKQKYIRKIHTLTQKQVTLLNKKAIEDDISESELVRRILDEYFEVVYPTNT